MNGRTVALAAIAMTAVVGIAVLGTLRFASANSAVLESTRLREDHITIFTGGGLGAPGPELGGTGRSVVVDASRYPPLTSFEVLVEFGELGETDGCFGLWDSTLEAVVPDSRVCHTESWAANTLIVSGALVLPQEEHIYQIALNSSAGPVSAARLRARWEEPKSVGGIPLDSNLRPLSLDSSQPSNPPWAIVVGIAAAACLLGLGSGAWFATRRGAG